MKVRESCDNQAWAPVGGGQPGAVSALEFENDDVISFFRA